MPLPASRLDLDSDLPPPRASWGRAVARLAFGVVFGAWSLLLIAWVTLYWGILPNARAWLPQIEQQAGRAIGAIVRIGDIRVQSGGWVPAVELTDVVLLDRAQREVLRLPRVAAVPAVRSLLAFELQFQQLLIDGAQLELRRDALGRIHVAGLELDADASAPLDSAALEWLLHQRELVVRAGRLRWVDEQRLAPPLQLDAVDVVVRNLGRRHEWRVDATPPPSWGDRFSLRARLAAPLLGVGDDWRRFGGEVFAEAPRIDGGELRRYVDLPFEWSEGRGALRAWGQLERGRLVGATADVVLESVSLRLAPALSPLQLQQVRGRLSAQRDARSWTLVARDFAFTVGDGGSWPASNLRLVLQQRDDARGVVQPVTGGELRADRLDLALMAAVAERLPLGDAVRHLLDALQPQGIVEPLEARWDGPLDAPHQYRVKAVVRDLAVAALPAPAGEAASVVGRPGWRGAHVDVEATERSGRAQLTVDGGALVLPGVFERPEVPLERFDARLEWQVESQPGGAPPRIALQVRDARFANADARGRFEARWRTGDGEGFGRGARLPGHLELDGSLDEGRAAAVARYLPLGLSASARGYVERAVRGGRLTQARFEVRGDLWDFPYADGQDGEFRIVGQAEGVDFAYVPDEPGWASPWPAFRDVAGELEFRRASMTVRNASARVYGVAMSGVQATIADLARAPVLQLDGTARGPVDDLLRYLNASPVGTWLGDVLADATVGGAGELQLGIRVPLDDAAHSAVRGALVLAGNDVRLAPSLPPLAAARGRVEFTHEGFTLRGAAARALGGDVTIDGGLGRDGVLRIAARGTARADGLRASTEIPALARVASWLDGEAPYRVQIESRGGQAPAIEVASDLVGMAVRLPAPLGKSAADALPLRFATTPLPAASGRGRDELVVELGDRVQARYEREFDGRAPRVRRGGIGVQEAAPWPAEGVAAVVTLRELDTAAWQAVLDRVGVDDPAAGGAASGYAPTQVGVRIDRLRADGRELTGLVAGATLAPGGGPWRITVAADQLAGYAEWRASTPSAPGGLRARLSRLVVPATDPASDESLLNRAPARVPALDVVVERFELAGKALGRLEVDAVNVPLADGSGAHEWRLDKLRLANDAAVFSATGRWRAAAGRAPARMTADFGLELADAGALLDRMGLPGTLRGGKGRLTGEVSWQGSPLTLHTPSLDGRLRLALGSGRFLKAEPGAARLLSVLSLQALPRRLALDFSDVFQDGFAFEDASGDVTIADGVARSNNLRLRGLQAAVLMEGQADLWQETQDLRVIVVPEISAGTASLVYSIINPAVGLGSFVAQLFLRQPLMQASTREFHVTGSWGDPKVERVVRTAEAAPAPANPAQ
jgi:uncharacterized protein (TIGR02099 family)